MPRPKGADMAKAHRQSKKGRFEAAKKRAADKLKAKRKKLAEQAKASREALSAEDAAKIRDRLLQEIEHGVRRGPGK